MKKEKIIFFVLLALVVIASFILYMMISSGEEENVGSNYSVIIESISAAEFREKISEDIVLIDIRTPQEFIAERIESAENIDYYSSTFRNSLNKLDKDKTYLIYCRSGSRSGNALEIMRDLGFKQVYDLRGGINSWKAMGFDTIN